jgi:hypothetical protein
MYNLIMEFDDQEWNRLANLVADAMRMTDAERTAFLVSRTARLIAVIPFAAACPDADRISLAHLATYILAIRQPTRNLFDHRPGDDARILARLDAIADFPGGDPATVRKGLALLGLTMLGGYRCDQAKDMEAGNYNPLNNASWDATTSEESLMRDARSQCAGEAVLAATITADEALQNWWEK